MVILISTRNGVMEHRGTMGALWSDFKDAADAWGFSPMEKRSLLNQAEALLFFRTKSANPLVIFDENYPNRDIVAFLGLSGEALFLNRLEYDGKFVYLKSGFAEEPIISLQQFPAISHEYNIIRAK